MDQQRIMELALNELLRQRAELDQEIEAIVSELGGNRSTVRQAKSVAPPSGTRRGRKRTAAEKKAHSIRMKQIWAARKAKAAKK